MVTWLTHHGRSRAARPEVRWPVRAKPLRRASLRRRRTRRRRWPANATRTSASRPPTATRSCSRSRTPPSASSSSTSRTPRSTTSPERSPRWPCPGSAGRAGGDPIVRAKGPDGREHLVRLLGGCPDRCSRTSTRTRRRCSRASDAGSARTNRGVRRVRAPGAWAASSPGTCAARPGSHRELDRFGDPRRRSLIERVLDALRSDVAPRLAALPPQVIHDDWNDYNVARRAGQAGAAARSSGRRFRRHGLRRPSSPISRWRARTRCSASPTRWRAAAAIVRGFHAVAAADGRTSARSC